MRPMPLARFDAPFEHPDWIFEPKLDGFRAVAYLEDGACRLVSRNGNALPFSGTGSLNGLRKRCPSQKTTKSADSRRPPCGTRRSVRFERNAL